MNQIPRSPNYLVWNSYSYCFRNRVPKDIQFYIGRKELCYSLQTGYLSLAKSRARLLAGKAQLLFRELKGNQLNKVIKAWKIRHLG